MGLKLVEIDTQEDKTDKGTKFFFFIFLLYLRKDESLYLKDFNMGSTPKVPGTWETSVWWVWVPLLQGSRRALGDGTGERRWDPLYSRSLSCYRT